MNIAIIGWGSLIWDPRELKTKSPWVDDGPDLPVEFARKSNNGRVTLVVYFGVDPSRTCWVLSKFDKLDDAREDLRKRENSSNVLVIHGVTKNGEPIGPPDGLTSVFDSVKTWLRGKRELGLDAAIWTGLKSNWGDFPELAQPFSPGAVVAYLKTLDGKGMELAKKYFVKAPRWIETPVRTKVIEELGWVPA